MRTVSLSKETVLSLSLEVVRTQLDSPEQPGLTHSCPALSSRSEQKLPKVSSSLSYTMICTLLW